MSASITMVGDLLGKYLCGQKLQPGLFDRWAPFFWFEGKATPFQERKQQARMDMSEVHKTVQDLDSFSSLWQNTRIREPANEIDGSEIQERRALLQNSLLPAVAMATGGDALRE